MYTIQSPLKIVIGKTKAGKLREFNLNLNAYRNAYFRTLNESKHKYKMFIVDQLQDKPRFEKIAIMYKVFKGDARRYDIGNIISIHQKYFEDAMVECGKLPDDKASNIPMVLYTDGGIDRDNPRVEIKVFNTNKEKDIALFKACLLNETITHYE